MDLTIVFTICLTIISVSCNMYSKDGQKCTKDNHGNEHCYKDDGYEEDDDDSPVYYDETSNTDRESLFIWEPVRVGFEREIEVLPGQKVKLVTKAMKPKIFQIENFLSDEEADHIVEKAKAHGLENSKLHLLDIKMSDKKYLHGALQGQLDHFSRWDGNGDDKIEMEEILQTTRGQLKLYINESEVLEMFKQLNMPELDDGIITKEEFPNLSTAGLYDYMHDLRQNHPRFKDRFSEQIWFDQSVKSDTIVYNLREKVIKLTNLPRYIVEGGEYLQVLRYQPFGHYHPHYDCQNVKQYPGKQCCHQNKGEDVYDCVLCRLLTIIYYLNDVPSGGETAFPVADKADAKVKEEFHHENHGHLYNLSKYCHNASLVIKPKKGRAILFYNHFLDDEGWLGEMDEHSLHGGCDVTAGEKWMANNWITGPPAKYSHLDSIY